MKALLKSWYPEDLEEAGALVREVNSSIPAVEGQFGLVTGKEVALDIAATFDAETAISWVEDYLPEMPARRFFTEVISSALADSAESAQAWLESVPDPKIRETIFEQLANASLPETMLTNLVEALETASPELAAEGAESMVNVFRGQRPSYPALIERLGQLAP